MRFALFLAAITLPFAPVAAAERLTISPADFDGEWPFYADEIELYCGLWENVPTVVFVAEGKIFPLDRGAFVTSWENGFNSLHLALKAVPQSRSQTAADEEGLVLLEPLVARARAVCPEKQE